MRLINFFLLLLRLHIKGHVLLNMASSKRGNLDSKSRKKVTQQDDDIDTSEWLDSDSDTLSSQSPSVANQYRPTGNKTEKPSGGTGQKKPTTNSFGAMTRSADDDDDEYSSIQDSDASDRVKGGMINRNSGATGQRSNDADATQTSRLRDDVGNRRAAANGGRFPEDERMNNGDDDLTYDYWSEMRPPTDDEVPLNIQDGNVAVPLPEGGLTFYGKPIFGSATDFDIWKARSDHGGGMPYRHGATDPWLSGLRRPVNYAEISRHDLKQQRERQKLQERVPWKSYTEIYAENNGQPVPGAMVTATGKITTMIRKRYIKTEVGLNVIMTFP
jgi:hypothetical protein